MPQEWLFALAGGILIGVSVSLMLALNGRVTGISGILDRALVKNQKDNLWRWMFLAGLLVGGLILQLTRPESFENSLQPGLGTVIVAGLLVGFGTVMGSGCTSGHGVCGISRLSPRSFLATIAFMMSGVLTVAVVRSLGWFA